MRKQYYTEYVRHCLRFYVMTLDVGTAPKFKTAADKNNWMCCHEVVSRLDQDDLEIVRELYSPGDTIPDKIYRIATTKRMSQSYMWSLIDDLECRIAQKRGLV